MCDMAEDRERVPRPVHPVAAPNNCCSVKQEDSSRGCENSGAGRCGPHLTLRGTVSCVHGLATSEGWSAPLRVTVPLKVGDGCQVPVTILPPGASASPTSDEWSKGRDTGSHADCEALPRGVSSVWTGAAGVGRDVCQGHRACPRAPCLGCMSRRGMRSAYTLSPALPVRWVRPYRLLRDGES